MAKQVVTLFTPDEVQTMHRYCLKYRDLVRSGGKASGKQSINFMRYQAITYSERVACD